VAVVRQKMKKTRVKEQIAGPRVITKRGSKTATRRSASASSERAEQGFVKVHLLRGGQLGPAPAEGPGTSTSCNWLRVLRSGPRAEILYRYHRAASCLPAARQRRAPCHAVPPPTCCGGGPPHKKSSGRHGRATGQTVHRCCQVPRSSLHTKRIRPHPSKNLRRRQEQSLRPSG